MFEQGTDFIEIIVVTEPSNTVATNWDSENYFLIHM